MAIHLRLQALLIMAIIAATISTDMTPQESQDLVVATEEMVTANYFTFVMLINMFPLDQRIQGNITFLMPNDRKLSKVSIPQDSVSAFLLRHSIPSPLLFDHLQHIPSGSTIPSSKAEYMLNIFNKGRKSFFLNNVRVSSPNICTAGSSIRCHGIDGVLDDTYRTPSPTCSGITSPAIGASPPAPPLPQPSPTPPVDDHDQIPVPAPPPDHPSVNPKKSGTSHSQRPSHLFLITAVLMSIARSSFQF